MIFTRYLYPKHNVIYSLYVSLAIADSDQANFWAYELYFSGFRSETVDLLLTIYENYYKQDMKLQKWLQIKVNEWKQDMSKPEIVITIIQNIIRREPIFEKFLEKVPGLGAEGAPLPHSVPKTSQKTCYISYKTIPPQYNTQLAVYTGGWKLPRQVCQYRSTRDPTEPELNITNYDNWLYISTGSPIWRTRIMKYGGKICEKTKSVKFSTEEAEEEFMNWFSLEPDEQPLSVQHAWFGELL